MISDDDFLSMDQVLERIRQAAELQQPFSFVRIGDGENFILAQESVWPVEYVLLQAWPVEANKGRKGVTLPNLTLRDQMVTAIQKADIVGIIAWDDQIISAPSRFKRELTDKIFDHYDMKPAAVCNAVMGRWFRNNRQFWGILKGRKILLISKWAEQLKNKLIKKPYEINVSLTIPFYHYDQLEDTLNQVVLNKDNFDIALISCGVNAVVLAHKVAELTGKIGIDFGKSSEFIVQGRVKYKG